MRKITKCEAADVCDRAAANDEVKTDPSIDISLLRAVADALRNGRQYYHHDQPVPGFLVIELPEEFG